MNIASTCESLQSNISNPNDFDKVLSDFISTFSTSTFEYSSISSDPKLETFIKLILNPYTRIDSKKDVSFGYIPKLTKFLLCISSSTPAIMYLVGGNIPVVKIVLSAIGIDPKHHVTYSQIFGLMAQTINSINPIPFTSEELSSLFKNFNQILEIPALAANGMSTFAALLITNPIFLSYVRASTELKEFRDITSTLLSCDDHISVVASLLALITIFPRSIDANTIKQAAIHAITVANECIILLRNGFALLNDINIVNTITIEEFNQVVKAGIVSCGMKAFLIFDGLNRILMNREQIGPLIDDTLDLDSIIETSISTPYGFVAQMILKMIDQIQYSNESFLDSLSHVKEHTEKAIKIVSAPGMSIDVDLVEVAASFLKMFALSPKCLEEISQMLIDNEETIFVAFQRHVEASDSYISLILFLFLSIVSIKIESWKKRIRLILIDSQFSALLAHVIEKTTDRKCLVDAVSALSQVSQFEIGDKICDHSVIFDSIISGFMAINSKNKEEENRFVETSKAYAEKNDRIISELKGQLEMNELEMDQIYFKLDQSENENSLLKQKIANLESIVEKSARNIEQLNEEKEQINKEMERQKQIADELAVEGAERKHEIKTQKEKIEELSKSLSEFKERDQQRLKIERENAAYEVRTNELEQQLSQAQNHIIEQNKAIEALKIKLRDLKAEYATKSNDFNNMESERQLTQVEITSLKERMEQAEQSRLAEREKCRLVKSKLRETITLLEEMQSNEIEYKRRIDEIERQVERLTAENADLTNERKQFELITQFVHRITDDNPIPPEQLMSMIDPNSH